MDSHKLQVAVRKAKEQVATNERMLKQAGQMAAAAKNRARKAKTSFKQAKKQAKRAKAAFREAKAQADEAAFALEKLAARVMKSKEKADKAPKTTKRKRLASAVKSPRRSPKGAPTPVKAVRRIRRKPVTTPAPVRATSLKASPQPTSGPARGTAPSVPATVSTAPAVPAQKTISTEDRSVPNPTQAER